MGLDEACERYLSSQSHGCLATVGPDGYPQNKPVGYRYNTELGTIDISGFNMQTSAKYRNVGVRPEVAFVVDDVFSEGAEGTRFLEIRGQAERVSVEPTLPHGLSRRSYASILAESSVGTLLLTTLGCSRANSRLCPSNPIEPPQARRRVAVVSWVCPKSPSASRSERSGGTRPARQGRPPAAVSSGSPCASAGCARRPVAGHAVPVEDLG